MMSKRYYVIIISIWASLLVVTLCFQFQGSLSLDSRDESQLIIYTHLDGVENNTIVLSSTVARETKWVNELRVSKVLIEVKFNEVVKETVFYTMTDGEIENNTDESSTGYFVIDRSGKI